ncbi:MAG TPA: toast rack family protein [Thermomicrobiales bacterium]
MNKDKDDSASTDQAAMIHESRVVERGNATQARATVQLGAGDLRLTGGGANLLDADFSYNVPSWRPELACAISGGTATVTVRQPEGQSGRKERNARQRWDLRFADDLPLALRVQAGAVTGALLMGDLTLTELQIETGAGTLTLDLAGVRQPFDVAIKGGVVNATIALPAALGVRVAVKAPIATVNAPGLRRVGGAYTNTAYEPRTAAVSPRSR